MLYKEYVTPLLKLNFVGKAYGQFCLFFRHKSIWNGIQALTVDGRSSPSVVIANGIGVYLGTTAQRNVCCPRAVSL